MNWFFRLLTCSLRSSTKGTMRSSSSNSSSSSSSSTSTSMARPGGDGTTHRRIIHFNHAGASPSSDTVLERVVRHLQQEQRLGGYAAAKHVQEELGAVYDKAARLIGASSSNEIALVESATVAWTRLFYAFAAHQEQQRSKSTTTATDKKIILVSEAEYAANVVAACQWAREHPGWSVWPIPSVQQHHNNKQADGMSTSTGKVDLRALTSMLSGTYKHGNNEVLDPRSIAMVCVTHVPTNSGIVNPVVEIGQLLADYNKSSSRNNGGQSSLSSSSSSPPILYLADTCQSVGQLNINVQEMKCSGLVATGRKYLRGPRGTGFLYVSNELIMDKPNGGLWPHHVDHFAVPISSVPSRDNISNGQPLQQFLEYAPRAGARRFEFWESNIAGRLGLGQALSEVLEQGQTNIADTIRQRVHYLADKLRLLGNGMIRLHHVPECGILTFWVPGLESSRLAQELQTASLHSDYNDDDDDDGHDNVIFEVSVVPATSTPLDSAATGVPDLLRVSVSHTTTEEEIDLLCTRLQSILSAEK